MFKFYLLSYLLAFSSSLHPLHLSELYHWFLDRRFYGLNMKYCATCIFVPKTLCVTSSPCHRVSHFYIFFLLLFVYKAISWVSGCWEFEFYSHLSICINIDRTIWTVWYKQHACQVFSHWSRSKEATANDSDWTEEEKKEEEDKSCWWQKQVDGELIIDCTCHRGDFKSTQISKSTANNL